MATIQIVSGGADALKSLSIEIAGKSIHLPLNGSAADDFTARFSGWKSMRGALEAIQNFRDRAEEAKQAINGLLALSDLPQFGAESDEHPTLPTTAKEHFLIPLSELAGILMEAEPSVGNYQLFLKTFAARQEAGLGNGGDWVRDMQIVGQIAFADAGMLLESEGGAGLCDAFDPSFNLSLNPSVDDEVKARGYFLRGRFEFGQRRFAQALGSFQEAKRL
ncbi:MAG: hypothetical protein ACPGRX_05920, partial [Bdellovibrionales bacterium]